MARYIDVSVHNGSIDFNKVKSAGITGVIIRAGYGRYISQKDKRFEENYKKAKAAGLKVGTYWYSYAVNQAQASEEAKVFLQAVKGKKFELPVAYDVEDISQSGLSSSAVGGICQTFMQSVQSAGYYISIYSMSSWLGTKIPSYILNKYDVWVAHYGVDRPAYKGAYGMWQYTSTARINGISTNVDCNKVYKDYPSIITKAGLNGYKKTSASTKKTTTTTKKSASTKNKSATTKKKSVNELAKEVIAGKWGNNPAREKKLKAAGYNYEAVQAEVNRILQHK